MELETKTAINNLNEMYKGWITATYTLVVLILGFFIGFSTVQIYNSGKDESKIIRIEVVKDSIVTPSIIKAKLDSIASIKLENDIKLVEEKNNGRFEVLTWSSVLVLTLLLVFLTINFIISGSKVREVVDIEIDKKVDEIKSKTDSFTNIYNAKIDEINKLIEELTILSENSEKEFEKIKDYATLAAQAVNEQ